MQNKIKNLIKKLSRFGYHVKPSNSRRMDPVCGMEATSDIIKAIAPMPKTITLKLSGIGGVERIFTWDLNKI